MAINPRYLKALTTLAVTLNEEGRQDEAMDACRRALEIDPESVDLHYQLGLIFADRGEFALALDRFQRVAKQDPKNVDYVANLALALQNMGLLDRAQAGWKTLCDVVHGASRVSGLPGGDTARL